MKLYASYIYGYNKNAFLVYNNIYIIYMIITTYVD